MINEGNCEEKTLLAAKNIKCNNIPILYKGTDAINNTTYDYVVINVFDNVCRCIITTSSDFIINNNITSEYVFPRYDGYFIASGSYYHVFNSVRQTLREYLNMVDSTKKNKIVNYFIINFYKLLSCANKNNYSYNLGTLDDIYVCDENRQIIDYEIRDSVYVTVYPNENVQPNLLFSDGLRLCLKQNNTSTNMRSNKNIFYETFRKFLILLRDNDIDNNILNTIINVSNYNNIDKVMFNEFSYAINYYFYRSGVDTTLDFYNFVKYSYHSIFNGNKNVTYDENIPLQFLKQYEKYKTKYDYNYIIDAIKNSNFDIRKKDYVVIRAGTLLASGIFNDKTTPMHEYVENKYYTNPILYCAHINYLEQNKYLNRLANLYSKNNSTSRIVILRANRDIKLYKIESDDINQELIYDNNYDLTYRKFPNTSLFQLHIIKLVAKLLFSGEIDSDKLNILKKIFIKNIRQETIVNTLAQDFLNLSLKNKFTDLVGYTDYNPDDSMSEIILLNYSTSVDMISVIKTMPDNIIIMNNIKIFNRYMEKCITNYADNYYADIEGKSDFLYAINFISNFDKIIDFLKNVSLYNNIYLSNIDPNVYSKIPNSFEINKFKVVHNKYLKYKKKYWLLKNTITR
jgi:hypothetical protein